MSEPQSTADLRILDEMADEIEKHGVCALPGSLMSLVRTERGKRVAKLVEKLARDVSAEKWARQVEIEAAQRTLEAQQDTINSEREMNHQLTTELQRQASGRDNAAHGFRESRERAGISLREMAKRLGVGATYLHQFETGKTPAHGLKVAYLAELAKAKKGGEKR